MTNAAQQLGFVFSRHGCACSGGTNDYYTATHDGKFYTLRIWPIKGVWSLMLSGYRIAWGNKENLTEKIKEIWD